MAVDWTVVSSLATGAGTLVLAVATFASVRSANRSARAAERSLLAGLRPLMLPSRRDDEVQKIRFGDGHYVRAAGGFAVVEVGDDAVYLAMNLRNAGQGIGVLHGWYVVTGTPWDTAPLQSGPGRAGAHPPVEAFRLHSRDMYVPGGDSGFWQGAIRDADDPARAALEKQVAGQESINIDLLYGDYEGGQRTITRFVLTPLEPGWLLSVVRHWNIDRPDPR